MNKFPAVGGAIGLFRDAILSISRSNQEDMALGAALAIAGALTSNRFHISGKPAHSAMYVLNVATTGSGKGAANDFVNELFSPSGIGGNKHFKLLGLRNYSSDVSIIGKLADQRTRLDVIDEFGQVFKGLAQKGDRKSAVGECLKILFSVKGYFPGHHTHTSGTIGACLNPAVSLLGSIQPETLINNASLEVLFDGFMGRFMYFMECPGAEWTGNHLNGGLDRDALDLITKACFTAYPENPLIDKDLFGNTILDAGSMEYSRSELFLAANVAGAIEEIDHQHFNMIREKKRDGDFTEAALRNRSVELTDKLAKIICVSYGERTITMQHLGEAMAIVEESTRRSVDFLKSAGQSVEHKNANKILAYVKASNLGQVKRSHALNAAKISSREFSDALRYLVATDQVEEIKIDNRSNAAVWLAIPKIN